MMYLEMSVEVRLEAYLKWPDTIYFVFVQELSRTRPLFLTHPIESLFMAMPAKAL